MAYVDLNPIRAEIAQTPETSDYTSVQTRIAQKTTQADTMAETSSDTAVQPLLKPFNPTTQSLVSIGYDLHDYLELVDYTGRAIRDDKRGFIVQSTPPILQRLGINPDAWLEAMGPKGIHMATVLGDTACIEDYIKAHHLRFIAGARRLKGLLQ